MLCPICKVALSMADRQGIEVDYCPQCRGVWLDRGELDKLIERAAAPPMAPPAMTPPPTNAPVYGMPAPNPAYPPVQRGYDDDDDDDDRYRYGQQPGQYRQRRKGFLGDIFDFD